jgi:hypothetical protein
MSLYPPFYVGQKVVCIHSLHPYIKGQQYIVGVVQQCPNCKSYRVGCIKHNIINPKNLCNCGQYKPLVDYILVSDRRFAPIIEDMQAITFEKITEQEPVSVN